MGWGRESNALTDLVGDGGEEEEDAGEDDDAGEGRGGDDVAVPVRVYEG